LQKKTHTNQLKHFIHTTLYNKRQHSQIFHLPHQPTKPNDNTQTTISMPELVGKNVGPIGYGLMGLFIAIYFAIAY